MKHKGLAAIAYSLRMAGSQLERHPGLENLNVEFPVWDDEGEPTPDHVQRAMRIRHAAQAILGIELLELDEPEKTMNATLEELGALLQYIAVRIENIKL
jgi:hypothetical protein